MALFRRKAAARTASYEVSVRVYTGDVPLDVKGESHYQDNLATIAGPKTEDGYNLPVNAVLVREPDNEYDTNAIAVYATTRDGQQSARHVGYVAAEVAEDLAPILDRKRREGETVALEGHIRGGWDRGGGDTGHYGIALTFDPEDFGMKRPRQGKHPERQMTGVRTGEHEENLGWLDGLPADSLAAIKYLRRLLADESNPINRHFMYLELEKLLYKCRDIFESALAEFEQTCREHDAEMDDAILPKLKEDFGGVPNLPTYRQVAIMKQKAHDFEAAIEWAQRGLALYGDRALRTEDVRDLESRVSKYEAKLGAGR